MPDISAFRGLRFDLGHVGALSDVVAPPYDVIDRELQDDLYCKHPANVVRLILNRAEPGDESPDDRYTRAGKFLRNWRSEGVLQLEPAAVLYVYHQRFTHDDIEYTRRGFMCRVRLERFGEGTIYPHEETHAAAKADRLKLIGVCKANLSQIFGLYPDSDNEVQDLLDAAIVGRAPIEATDHLGVVHRMWPLTDVSVIARATALMGPRPMFIADGHHRYETACNWRDQLAAEGPLDANHPAQSVLTMCVGMSDPGMIVLPTHRLFRGLAPLSADELAQKLGDCFETRVAGHGAELAGQVWQEIELEQDQGMIGLFTAQDQQWTVARITEQGQARMDAAAAERSVQWRGLGVSILQRLLLETLLGATDLPNPHYVHLVDEVVAGLSDADESFPLAALVMPATLEHIRQISEHQERMPAKSTYFFPKLLSGLVINPLE